MASTHSGFLYGPVPRTNIIWLAMSILIFSTLPLGPGLASPMSSSAYSSSSVDDTGDAFEMEPQPAQITVEPTSQEYLVAHDGDVDDDEDDDVGLMGNETSTSTLSNEEICRCEAIRLALEEVSDLRATCVGTASRSETNERRVNALQIAVDGLAAIIDVTLAEEIEEVFGDSSTTSTTTTTEKGTTVKISPSRSGTSEVPFSSSSLDIEVNIPLIGPKKEPTNHISNVIDHQTNPKFEIPPSLQGVNIVIMEEPSLLPNDCLEVQRTSGNVTGVYTILPEGCGKPFQVYCDMNTEGGGWTVLQRRQDGSEDFERGWASYRRGFGNLLAEFWLGLDKMHRLTVQDEYELLIDVIDFNGTRAFAEYESILISGQHSNYRLNIGSFKPNGSAGDSFSYHDNMPFTTYDRDNDLAKENCATIYPGGWWYNACLYSNLNSAYLGPGRQEFAKGITWFEFSGFYTSLKFAEMKIRPVP